MIRPAWKSPIPAFVLLAAVFFSAWLTLSVLTGAGNRVAAASVAQPLAQVDPDDASRKRTNSVSGDGMLVSIHQITGTQIFINQAVNGTISLTPTIETDVYWLVTELGAEYEVKLSESPISANYTLELSVYDSNQIREKDPVETSASRGEALLQWEAKDTKYFFRVTATPDTTQNAPYQLIVERTSAAPSDWDACEINDTLTGTWSGTNPPSGPCPISVNALVSSLNFVPFTGQPSPNLDYFAVSVKAGRRYRVETTVTAGVDTVIYLYPPGATDDSQPIASNDDAPGLGLGSRIEWTPAGDGVYVVKVENREPLPHESDETYSLSVTDVTATPTPSQTPGGPTATPTRPLIPGTPDAYEPNWEFKVASLIGLGVKYTNLNFVPYSGTGTDNDFFKLWVTGGKLYTCETLDLGDATNTNMILYSCPSFDCGFAGNDDIQPFDPNDPYRSKITFFSSYTGYLYLLLGQVGVEQILPGEWAKLSYSLQCYIELPGTATPTPTSAFVPAPPQPTSTPAPGTPVPLPPPTRVVIIVVPMTTPQPPAPPPPLVTPTPQLYVINVVVYYDRNGNGLVDPGEGIRDVLTRVFDAITDDLLSIDYTDEIGRIQFTIPSRRPVRVSVPFFGFEQIVTTTDANLQIRISPVR